MATYLPNFFKAYLSTALIAGVTSSTIVLDRITTLTGETIETADLSTLGAGYLTINPEGDGLSSYPETAKFTGVTAATKTLTGVTRGITKAGAESTTYMRYHPVGTPVIISFGVQNISDLVTYLNSLVVSTRSVIVSGTAGETIAAGNLVYFSDSDNEWMKCDADTAATVENVMLGIAQGAGVDGGTIATGVLLLGKDTTNTGLTAGQKYFASNTAGGISTTAGTKEVSIGFGTVDGFLYFQPRFDQQLTEDLQDALAGTLNSPSSTNPFVTGDDVSSAVDQSQTTQDASVEVGEANATTKRAKLAQSFVAGKPSGTGAVLHKAADTGSFTGTVTISLQADSSSAPSGSALATVTLTNATWLAIPVGKFAAIFGTAYAMVEGTTYWLVIETSTNDNSNHPNIGTNSVGGYSSGSVKFQNTTDGWTAIATIDLYFEILTTTASKALRADSNGFLPGRYFADVGSTDAYYIVARGVTVLTTGQRFTFKAATSNTGAATLNVNSLGAKTIKKNKTATLADGDILGGQIVEVVYDSTTDTFMLLTPVANSASFAALFTNGTASKDSSDASTTQNIAHSLGVSPKKVRITAVHITGAGVTPHAFTAYNGTTQSSVSVYLAGGGTYVQSTDFTLNGANASATQTGVVTVDSTNIIITWTKTGSPTGVYVLLWEAEA